MSDPSSNRRQEVPPEAPSARGSRRPLLLLFVLVALPLAGSLYSHSDGCFVGAGENLALHAVLEAQGGLACLALAVLLLFLRAPKTSLSGEANLIIAAG